MTALPGTTGRKRIYLMRHGHVDYFAEEVRDKGMEAVPLTDLGREQATASGKALSHIQFDRIITSGLPRTQETGQIVCTQLETDVPAMETIPGLVEIGTGRPIGVDSREALIATMLYQFDTAYEPGARLLEGGEFFQEAYDRAVVSIEALLHEPHWHTSLVVAHEAINRLILGWATGNGLRAVGSFEQDLACINVLDFDLVPEEGGSGAVKIERKIIKTVNLTPYNITKHGMNLMSLEFIFSEL